MIHVPDEVLSDLLEVIGTSSADPSPVAAAIYSLIEEVQAWRALNPGVVLEVTYETPFGEVPQQ